MGTHLKIKMYKLPPDGVSFVLSGVLRTLCKDPYEVVTQVTAFGSGYGRIFCEVCGALSDG